ncbi:ATP-binding protein [Vibrio campbellii]|nr:ATP-binding protein [Vibrio campbellii]
MIDKQLSASHGTVAGKFKNTSKPKAFAEYIWNSIDAGATRVEIQLDIDEETDQINSICVVDNGSGIRFEEQESPFDSFENSSKKGLSTPLVRGKYGRGRLAFFKFCTQASWITKHIDNPDTKEINVVKNALDKFSFRTLDSSPLSLDTGTRVVFNHFQEPAQGFSNLIKAYLEHNVTWINYFIPNTKIIFNEDILERPKPRFNDTSSQDIKGDSVNFDVLVWDKKIDVEDCGIYYCDLLGNVIHKENSKSKNSFFYTCIVKSEWFNQFSKSDTLLSNKLDTKSDKFIEIRKVAKNKINSHYLSLRRSAIDELIDGYVKDGIIPPVKSNSPIELFKDKQLKDAIRVIYSAEASVFDGLTNKIQKKILVKLIDRIINTEDANSLFDVLDGIISLDNTEMKALSESLQTVTMSNIVKTIKMLEGRLQAIDLFEQILANKDDAYEVDHIQKVVESNMWLFGEEYHVITAEEVKFDKALREHLKFKYECFEDDDVEKGIYHPRHYDKYKIDHEHKYKEMDIFASKKIPFYEQPKHYFKNAVVELKRPSIKLTDTEYQQIFDYYNVIVSEEKFDTENDQWDFFLVGNRITDNQSKRITIDSLLKNNKDKGKHGLLLELGDNGNIRVWIKEWSQIIGDFRLRYNHIIEALNRTYNEQNQECNPDKLTQEIRELSYQN